MKIIDWQAKGNSVRFYLGVDELETWWGDDWNDSPWDCNAGMVYEEFVRSYIDVGFPFGVELAVTGEGEFNTRWSKIDMREQSVPMFTVVNDRQRLPVMMGASLSVVNDLIRLGGAQIFDVGEGRRV